MVTSKEVTAKRKAGLLLDALEMGRELVAQEPNDLWNSGNHAWTIVALIKAAVKNNDFKFASSLVTELQSLKLDHSNDLLVNNVEYVLKLANPMNKAIVDAKLLSKQGNHGEAIKAFRVAIQQFPHDISLHESLAWELYKHGKQYFNSEDIKLGPAKQILADYIKLQNPRPSILHSLFLKLADKLLGKEGFNLVAFLQLWDLENLMDDDFCPYKADNGNVYSSIAEKIIQHASKDALSSNNRNHMEYILPYVDVAINRFSENIWLVLNKTKLLHALGKDKEALSFAISIVKVKINEYWAWDLLGEILMSSDIERGFSCYCKALLCKSEPKFIANVRIKFAKLLIQRSMFNEAKYEIDLAIKSRIEEGWKLTEELIYFQNSEWYQQATAAVNNIEFYKQNTSLAESLLFDNLPWLNASLGNTFTTTKNPDKPKRKIFITMPNQLTPVEISVSERRYSFKRMQLGNALKIKGEYDADQRFKIYLIEARFDVEKWDIFPEHIGMIDHVNYDKKLAHFIVDRKIDGIIHFEDFAMKLNVADIVSLKLASHTNDRGTQYSVLSCQPTNREISPSIAKKFQSTVRVSNGLGFTANDVFIDRPFVDHYNMQDGDSIEGLAVLNYNKKKSTWGWKALKIYKHEKSIPEINFNEDEIPF